MIQEKSSPVKWLVLGLASSCIPEDRTGLYCFSPCSPGFVSTYTKQAATDLRCHFHGPSDAPLPCARAPCRDGSELLVGGELRLHLTSWNTAVLYIGQGTECDRRKATHKSNKDTEKQQEQQKFQLKIVTIITKL